MKENKKKFQNEESIVDNTPVNEDFDNNNKKGKTISMKSALIVAGGILAGRATRGFQSEANVEPVPVTGNTEQFSTGVFTDENGDGIYELGQVVEAEVVEETAEAGGDEATGGSIPQGQPFVVATAPHASSPNDDMSFPEAFASAREELGPGGVFSWNGQSYTTFYAEEVDDYGNPVIDYDTVEEGSQNFENIHEPADDSYTASSQDELEGQVNVLGVDADSDGSVETYLVDANLDGSADAIYVDTNVDGQITTDEVQIIHDPATLQMAENQASGAEISVDTNADGLDDAVFADVDGDLVADVMGVDQNQNQAIEENEIQVLNPDAIQGDGYENAGQDDSGGVIYESEISSDMPEDVPDSELDNFTAEVSQLEDNFPDYNEWV